MVRQGPPPSARLLTRCRRGATMPIPPGRWLIAACSPGPHGRRRLRWCSRRQSAYNQPPPAAGSCAPSPR